MNNKRRLYKKMRRNGIIFTIIVYKTTIVIKRSITIFDKEMLVDTTTKWRNNKTDDLIEAIESKNEDIAFLGMRMLFNRLNLKEKTIDELINESI